MPVGFSSEGIGRQRTSQSKLNKPVAQYDRFLAMAGARFERQFLAASSFFGLAIGFFWQFN